MSTDWENECLTKNQTFLRVRAARYSLWLYFKYHSPIVSEVMLDLNAIHFSIMGNGIVLSGDSIGTLKKRFDLIPAINPSTFQPIYYITYGVNRKQEFSYDDETMNIMREEVKLILDRIEKVEELNNNFRRII